MIAERASVVPAMLVRYYGGKAGVFAAAVHFDLDLPRSLGGDARSVSRALTAHFITRWERAENGGDLVALLRASGDHVEAREKMLLVFRRQLVPAIAEVVGEADCAEASALIASQMLGLAFCRYVLEVPSVRALSSQVIVDAVGATIEGYLSRYAK